MATLALLPPAMTIRVVEPEVLPPIASSRERRMVRPLARPWRMDYGPAGPDPSWRGMLLDVYG